MSDALRAIEEIYKLADDPQKNSQENLHTLKEIREIAAGFRTDIVERTAIAGCDARYLAYKVGYLDRYDEERVRKLKHELEDIEEYVELFGYIDEEFVYCYKYRDVFSPSTTKWRDVELARTKQFFTDNAAEFRGCIIFRATEWEHEYRRGYVEFGINRIHWPKYLLHIVPALRAVGHCGCIGNIHLSWYLETKWDDLQITCVSDDTESG